MSEFSTFNHRKTLKMRTPASLEKALLYLLEEIPWQVPRPSNSEEIPSPCVHVASTSFLLDGGSLPPDFASRELKSLAVLTR